MDSDGGICGCICVWGTLIYAQRVWWSMCGEACACVWDICAGMCTVPGGDSVEGGAGGVHAGGVCVYAGMCTARCMPCQGVCPSTCTTCIHVEVSPVAVPGAQRHAAEHCLLTWQWVGEFSCKQVAGEQP